jgi:hypothetical protein
MGVGIAPGKVLFWERGGWLDWMHNKVMLPPRSGPIATEPDRVRKYNAAPLLLLSRGSQAVLWNRNRRNRNFLPCGTGTVTCHKIGTGTVINYGSGTVIKWYHKSSQKHRVQNCVFDFLHLTFFNHILQ